MRKMHWAMVAAVATALGAVSSVQAAPFSYTGGLYQQSFDGLPNSGTYALTGHGPFDLTAAPINGTNLTGWSIWQTGGTGANMDFRFDNGAGSGSTGRGIDSYGAASSPERALGGLATSADIPTLGAVFTNNTGGLLDTVTISFTGEQWHRGDAGTHDTLAFAYGLATTISASLTNNSNLDFIAPNQQTVNVNAALNGNDPANQAAVSYTLTGLNWADGTTLAIRWSTADFSGSDDGLAIDDFNLTGSNSGNSPEPASLGLLAIAGLCGVRRRRS